MKTKGELVTPKDFPELKSKVKQRNCDSFSGEVLYRLENNCLYSEDELS